MRITLRITSWAYHGEEEFLVKIPETRRVLALMDAVRESGRTEDRLISSKSDPEDC